MAEFPKIIALVPDAATCVDSLKIARAAASMNPNARIIALHVQVDPRYLVTSEEELAIQQLRETWEGTSLERRDATYRAFQQWLEASGSDGTRVEWRERAGAEEALVDEECHDADLVTVGRPQSLDGEDALHAALFTHRHLVLHTPPLPDDAEPVIGRSMAIAWKPTEPTRDAIRRTSRWLMAADKVHLIAVARDDIHDALELLKHQAIEPEIHVVSKGAGSVGDTIAEYATSLAADSLVMGAYRYGEFVEYVLGGVTHDILSRGNLPAFLVH